METLEDLLEQHMNSTKEKIKKVDTDIAKLKKSSFRTGYFIQCCIIGCGVESVMGSILKYF